ncbi:MAG TPA: hypothetical protein VD731_02290 [Nitrosopumilaceae archaeon]|nr:hypothetical protein [Nitrosopumilaceae archaeon]
MELVTDNTLLILAVTKVTRICNKLKQFVTIVRHDEHFAFWVILLGLCFLQVYFLRISSYINDIPIEPSPEPIMIGLIHKDKGKSSIMIDSKLSVSKKYQIQPKQKSVIPTKIPTWGFLNIRL